MEDKSIVYCFQHAFWFLQIASNADGRHDHSSPLFFQNLMGSVLARLIWKTTVPYLDECSLLSTSQIESKPSKMRIQPYQSPLRGSCRQQRGHQGDLTKIAAFEELLVSIT